MTFWQSVWFWMAEFVAGLILTIGIVFLVCLVFGIMEYRADRQRKREEKEKQ